MARKTNKKKPELKPPPIVPGFDPERQRASKAQTEERVRQTELMMSKGWTTSKIIKTLRANYGIGKKSCERLITKVYKAWRKQRIGSIGKLRDAQVNRLHSMLEDEKTETRERIRIEQLLARVTGTEQPIQHSGVGGEPIKMILEDYRETKPEPK